MGKIRENPGIISMIKIDENDLIDLIRWARRYCDGRNTFAPSCFNDIYFRLRKENPNLFKNKDPHDFTLMNQGAYWPFAQDGMYNSEKGDYDALPQEIIFNEMYSKLIKDNNETSPMEDRKKKSVRVKRVSSQSKKN